MKREEAARKWCRGCGTEIGAFTSPIPGISPIYVDKFQEYANEKTNAQYYGDACELPFQNDSLDYVASSHVLEHTANPVQALLEWFRVLKPGGIVFMVVPDKNATFDSPRKVTPADHLIQDYLNCADDTDPTHIDDFVYGVSWAEFAPQDPEEDWDRKRDELARSYREATARGNIINIHFHVFSPESLKELIETSNDDPRVPFEWTIETIVPRFPDETPNGTLVILRKPSHSSFLDSLKRLISKFRSANYPLLDTAQQFD